MAIRSVSHTGVTVSNFERAVKWYYEKFGFRLIEEQILPTEQTNSLFNLYGVKDATVRLGFLRAPKGGAIEIFEFSPAVPAQAKLWNSPGFNHVALDVRNVHKWHEKLCKQGVEFFSAPQKTGSATWVFLKDPDGNLIELIDLKANYLIIRWLGGIAGSVMARKKFKKYY